MSTSYVSEREEDSPGSLLNVFDERDESKPEKKPEQTIVMRVQKRIYPSYPTYS